MSKGLRIVSLAAENFKKLTAIEITPQEDVVMITGKNGAGKSSVLDCITAALKGEREIPEEPIKKGADKGGIRMDLGSFQVIRNFTKKGSYLKIVKEIDGAPFEVKSPQKFLDEIVGKISFDPLEFMNLLAKDKKAARKTLASLVGLDTSDVDDEIAKMKADRQLVGKDHEQKVALLRERPFDKELGLVEISVAGLLENYQKVMEQNNRKVEKEADVHASKEKVFDLRAKVTAGRAKIEKMREELAAYEGLILSFENDVDAAEKTIASMEEELLTMPFGDVEVYKTEISQAEAKNETIRKNKRSFEISQDADKLAAKYESMTEQIRAFEKIKADRVAGCKMPVEDLEIGDQGIIYKGVPLEQAGDGEKLVVSMAISMAMNPKLKVLRIKDGSLLDSKNLEIIRNMVKDNGFQVWIEKVAEDGRYGIYIEEGEVHQEPAPVQAELPVE
jgi:DNA repair exonuclease SbcCD ATPase subunit